MFQEAGTGRPRSCREPERGTKRERERVSRENPDLVVAVVLLLVAEAVLQRAARVQLLLLVLAWRLQLEPVWARVRGDPLSSLV